MTESSDVCVHTRVVEPEGLPRMNGFVIHPDLRNVRIPSSLPSCPAEFVRREPQGEQGGRLKEELKEESGWQCNLHT